MTSLFVRRLRGTVLLALGLAPAAACRNTVVVDCSRATPADNGLLQCGEIQTRKTETTCSLPPPDEGACSSAVYSGCTTDADCSEHPNGRCQLGESTGCSCSYGCESDADCQSDEACLCGATGGVCVSALCRTSGDCGDGQACVLYTIYSACWGSSGPGFACTSDSDECLADADCPDHAQGQACVLEGDHFACSYVGCMEGRPFYVGGELRTAPVVSSREWLAPLTPHIDFPLSVRAALATRWQRIGQLEHASVASFARFALQLVALGAPPGLVDDASCAMRDESLHARLAFGLASAYAGTPLGPGPLDVERALDAGDLGSIVGALIHEGCVGETFAAALAREELERAVDPVVRSVLGRIAEDEERHAVLAWRALAWIASTRDIRCELLAELRRLEIELATRPPVAPSRDVSPELQEHGVLGDDASARIRREVIEAIAVPALRALARGDQRVTTNEAIGVSPVASEARFTI